MTIRNTLSICAQCSLVVLCLFSFPEISAAQECTSLCNDCAILQVIVTDGQPPNSTKEIDVDCQLWPCTGMTCINVENQEELDLMVTAVEENDTEAFLATFMGNPDFLLNPERTSLQLRSSCDLTQVVANLPLSRDQFRSLLAVAEEDQVILH